MELVRRYKTRDEIPDEYKWDLTPLFENDEAWEKALQEIQDAPRWLASYEGRLGESAETLLQYLQLKDSIILSIQNILSYADLKHHLNLEDPICENMIEAADNITTRVSEACSFDDFEIISLPETTIIEYLNSDILSCYKYRLTKLLQGKYHILSAQELHDVIFYLNTLTGLSITQSTPSNIIYGSIQDKNKNITD